MRLDYRFALRDSVKDLGDTVADIIADDVPHKHSCQSYADGRCNQEPPRMLSVDQIGIDQPVKHAYQRLENKTGKSREHAHEETEQQYQLFLGHMRLAPCYQPVRYVRFGFNH